MSKYEGLYTFDVDNHRYIPVGQADGIIDCFKFKHESKEPLIKDEKIRKAVRAWADANGYSLIRIGYRMASEPNNGNVHMHFLDPDIVDEDKLGVHTLAELCGEEEE